MIECKSNMANETPDNLKQPRLNVKITAPLLKKINVLRIRRNVPQSVIVVELLTKGLAK